jgi:hypothetical protein
MTLTAEPLTGQEEAEAKEVLAKRRKALKQLLSELSQKQTPITPRLQKKIYHAARCAGYGDKKSRKKIRNLGVPEGEILAELPVPTRLPGASPVHAKRSVVLAPVSMPSLVPAT